MLSRSKTANPSLRKRGRGSRDVSITPLALTTRAKEPYLEVHG